MPTAPEMAPKATLARRDEAIEVAAKLPRPATELHAEGHGFGVDAMGATNAEGVALLEGAALTNLAELAAIIDEDIGRLNELVAERGVAQVGAGHTVVHPTAGRLLALRHVASMHSAMFVVNAMTSWFVTFSISSMRSTVKSACARIHAAPPS